MVIRAGESWVAYPLVPLGTIETPNRRFAEQLGLPVGLLSA